MKYLLNIRTFASIGLTLGLAVGCGGGSSSGDSDSSDGGSGSPSSGLELSPETAEVMANNVSKAFPGCTYASGGVASARSEEVAVRLYRKTIDGIVNNSKETLSARSTSARDINETQAGNCPSLPGSFSIVGSHDDGVDDITYTFNDYCTASDDGSATIVGTLTVKSVGEPSASGPIPQYATVSTGGSGLQIAEVTSEGTFNHSATVDNFKYTFGNGDEQPTMAKPDLVTIDSLVVIDGRENKEFNVANVSVSQYTSGTDKVVKISNITYTDPDTGSVDISTTPMKVDENGVFSSGSITATGAEGSTVEFTKSSSVENAFDVAVGEETLGVMNCSEL